MLTSNKAEEQVWVSILDSPMSSTIELEKKWRTTSLRNLFSCWGWRVVFLHSNVSSFRREGV